MKNRIFGLFIMYCLNSAQAQVPDTVEQEVPSPKARHGITTGITVPQPLSIGYEWNEPELPQVHFFAEGGYFAYKLSSKLRKISVWSLQGGARLFPTNSWWYVSGALGFRQIGLGTDISGLKLDGVSLANNADLTLNTFIFSAALGGQWFLSPKVALSVEIGMQLPVPGLHWGSTKIVQEVSDGSDLSVDDSDALSRITNIPVPQIALVRFIWYLD